GNQERGRQTAPRELEYDGVVGKIGKREYDETGHGADDADAPCPKTVLVGTVGNHRPVSHVDDGAAVLFFRGGAYFRPHFGLISVILPLASMAASPLLTSSRVAVSPFLITMP